MSIDTAAWALPGLAQMLAVLVALAVDHWLGEPPTRWHPVVWMGHYLGYFGRWVQRHAVQHPATHDFKDFKAFWLAAVVWSSGAAFFTGVAWALQTLLISLPWWLAVVLLGALLKPLLAWAMLKNEVLAVEAALGQSLAVGRARLAWLVSRDTTTLTESQVRESAIESLAENLNDSVVAPIFWFVLLGLPGAALYRFANTADAMWGYRGLYKGQNWEWAGKWAARADDVLSWVPARLTAVLLWAASRLWGRWLFGGRSVDEPHAQGWLHGFSLRRLRHEAPKTPSPNSGWPMAAMALGLGVQLAKPGVYVLNPSGQAPATQALVQAVAVSSKALVALVPLMLVAIIVVALMAGGGT